MQQIFEQRWLNVSIAEMSEKNWFTSQRSLTFLDPATKASLSSTILWDSLNLTVARSGSLLPEAGCEKVLEEKSNNITFEILDYRK